MQKKIDEYFANCDKKGEVYTVTGLALALNMSRMELIRYAGRPEFSDTIKKAKARVEAELERRLYGKNGNVAGIIFGLKNNFGWEEVQKNEASGTLTIKIEHIGRRTDEGNDGL